MTRPSYGGRASALAVGENSTELQPPRISNAGEDHQEYGSHQLRELAGHRHGFELIIITVSITDEAYLKTPTVSAASPWKTPMSGVNSFTLDDTWRELLEHGDYPPTIKQVLGEAMAATALLAATIKFEGTMSLQIRGSGPLTLLVVEATSPTTLRGLARWRGQTERMDFTTLMGDANLTLNINPGHGRERYQGIVDMDGDHLAEVLENYFYQSEQLPTRLWLGANHECSGGLLLQRLPNAESQTDVWSRLEDYTRRLDPEALLDTGPEELLPRLFYDQDVRLYQGETLTYRCGCTQQRVEDMLRALGEAELQSILAEENEIRVSCEFCAREYVFDAVDAGMLNQAPTSDEPSTTRH